MILPHLLRFLSLASALVCLALQFRMAVMQFPIRSSRRFSYFYGALLAGTHPWLVLGYWLPLQLAARHTCS